MEELRRYGGRMEISDNFMLAFKIRMVDMPFLVLFFSTRYMLAANKKIFIKYQMVRHIKIRMERAMISGVYQV